MFLYLSKLIPLFLYPLGLASISLVVALITLWKRPRIAAIAISISLSLQNAVNVRKILVERGINRVLLVTSALHMPRSLRIFRHQGIDVIPTPTDFIVTKGELKELGNSKAAILNLVPDIENLSQFTRALKEYIGSVVYFLRGWL